MALERLLDLRRLPKRLIVGLMSGTSGDGVDAALVEIAGCTAETKAKLLGFTLLPYPLALRERLFRLTEANASELCELSTLLGETFAQAAGEVVRRAGLDWSQVHLIASHGHTACHQPRSAGKAGATLQIGEGAILAERSGLPVVCDFRVRDLAAGGEGAPLVPLPDWILFHVPDRVLAVQNIGGIANVTIVTPSLDDVFAFDNAPGNMVLDAVARAASHGAEAYDMDGRRAAQGTVDERLLADLLAHPFLAQVPPKSTGREVFGLPLMRPLIDAWGARLDDLAATCTRFVAAAIAQSLRTFVFPRVQLDELLVSGGGVHNQTLMRHLRELVAPIPVRSIAELGWNPDAKEALAFAILANETLHGHTGNIPAATGASGPRVLGKILL